MKPVKKAFEKAKNGRIVTATGSFKTPRHMVEMMGEMAKHPRLSGISSIGTQGVSRLNRRSGHAGQKD